MKNIEQTNFNGKTAKYLFISKKSCTFADFLAFDNQNLENYKY